MIMLMIDSTFIKLYLIIIIFILFDQKPNLELMV
jgi:hypothetical protein